MHTESETDPSRETRRLFWAALLVAALVLALHFSPLKHWLTEAQTLKARVGEMGWKAHALFVAASVSGIALGVPRLLLCALGGVLFGFVEGVLASQFAGVLGAYAAFLLTRLWGPKAWVQRRLAGSERLRRLLSKPSIGTIFVARQLPIPGIVPNVLLGVLNTSHRTFLLGTFLGYLPSNIPVALAGSSMAKESLSKAIAQVSLSMLAVGVFGAGVMVIRRRLQKESAAAPLPANPTQIH